LPIAQTHWPGLSDCESPSTATGTSSVALIFSNATSIMGSTPTSSARKARPSTSVTVMRSAPSTTWKLVRRYPDGSMKKPLPDPSRGAPGSSTMSRRQRGPGRPRPSPRTAASTFTTAAFTRAATAAKSTAAPVVGANTGAGWEARLSGGASAGWSAVAVVTGRGPPDAATSPSRKPTTDAKTMKTPAARVMTISL
jgi:hypothetical protein